MFVIASIATITALCVPFLLGQPYPDLLTFVGRWIPLAIALIVLWRLPVGGRPTALLGLHSGGWRRLLAGIGTAIVVFLGLAFVPAALAQLLGLGTLQGWDVLGPALVQLPIWIAVYSISTIGEEAAWRGYAHQLLRHRGFWFAALVVALAWGALHVPQLAIFGLAGEMSGTQVATGVLGVAVSALPLAALAERFHSVWPAVVAHAVPFTATTVLTQATDGGAAWVLLAITSVVSVGATLALRAGGGAADRNGRRLEA